MNRLGKQITCAAWCLLFIGCSSSAVTDNPNIGEGKGDTTAAQSVLDEAIEQHEAGDLEAAAAQYQAAIDADPKLADAWVGIGAIHAEQGRLPNAIDAYGKALEIDPDNMDAWLNRGVAWHASGKTGNAIADYQRILDLDSEDPDASRNMALVYMDELKWDEAIQQMTRAMMVLPYIDSDLYRDRSECWRNIGNEAQADLDVSIADATAALDDDPGDLEARMARASALLALGEFEFAVGDCDEILVAEADSAIALEVRADAHLALGNNGEAEAGYTRLVELNSTSAVGFVGRGLARESQGEFKTAVDDLEAALKIDAQEQGAALRLAWILAACPDDDVRNGPRALEVAKAVCESRNWQDWVALNSYAVASAEVHQFDEAAARQKTAIQLAPPVERPPMEEQLRAFEAKQAWRFTVEG